MNSNRDLLKRLLHLFPIKIVKEYFNRTGNADDVIEAVTGDQAGPAIKTFSRTNYLQTKQNIYLFKLNRNFNRQTMAANFPYTIETETLYQNDYSFFCFPKTTLTVYLSNPTAKEDSKFFQPVTIRISGRTLIIHFTKLIKSEKYYWPEDRSPKKAAIDNNEQDILNNILNFFKEEYTVTELDINVGVKYIWHIDDVDCVKLHWREAHSMDGCVMDETLTFKLKYPLRYAAVILTPLGKTNFIYLKDDEYFCDEFTADPSSGFISITSSPKLPNQVINVLSKILANN